MIPEEYKNIDTIFHYTKFSTALESILNKGYLRLSPRIGTVDPYENNKLFIQYSSCNFPGAKIADQEKGDEVKEVILERFNSIRQISFCMNDNSIEIQKQTGSGSLEYYGFIKPRMWEQYADSYKGICIALSLNKILNNFQRLGVDIITDKVKYEKSSYIKSFDYGINMNRLYEIDKDEFIKEYFIRIEKRIFKKYLDYKDENEYRICGYSRDMFVPFDISDCMLGIIFCNNYVSEIYYDILEKYSDKYNINLTSIDFGNQGITIKNKKTMHNIAYKP